MTEPYWTLRPAYGVMVPPAEEYLTILSWLEAWPEGTTVYLDGHDGAPSTTSDVEALIDSLLMAPVVEGMMARHGGAQPGDIA